MYEARGRPDNIVWLAIGFEGGLILLAWVVGATLGHPPFAQIHLSWGAIAVGIVATLPPLLALHWCLRSDWGPLKQLFREVDEMLVPLFRGCSHFELALISLLAGLGEEALFRGVFQTALTDWTGPVAGLLMASALFGLAHLVTRTYAVLAGLVGLYLGALALTSGNLLIPVLVHGLYDLVALTYLVRKHRAPGTVTP